MKILLSVIGVFFLGTLCANQCDCSYYATAEFLYWKGRQDKLQFAVSGVNASGLTSLPRG